MVIHKFAAFSKYKQNYLSCNSKRMGGARNVVLEREDSMGWLAFRGTL